MAAMSTISKTSKKMIMKSMAASSWRFDEYQSDVSSIAPFCAKIQEKGKYLHLKTLDTKGKEDCDFTF